MAEYKLNKCNNDTLLKGHANTTAFLKFQFFLSLPLTYERIRCTNYLLSEHRCSPVLAHDESGSSKTNEETGDGKRSGTVDKTDEGTGDRSSHEYTSHQNTGSELITKGSKNKTHDDGSGNGANVGGPDILLADVERNLYLGKKRGDGEPNEESNEESPPRAMESTHVGSGEVAKLDFGCLIILVGVNLTDVSLVFLELVVLMFDCCRCSHAAKNNCVRKV